ncbi:hypothetical protein E2C01_048661 [Portunus trituberculatus]|uniref:Uncharacterized protein n=1 Tax=Portunus trituberculatus TaxID=210409 RepID=A0A5B7GB50_PORTR|nr:hypothetical protein [Portunus trituberculatus]
MSQSLTCPTCVKLRSLSSRKSTCVPIVPRNEPRPLQKALNPASCSSSCVDKAYLRVAGIGKLRYCRCDLLLCRAVGVSTDGYHRMRKCEHLPAAATYAPEHKRHISE